MNLNIKKVSVPVLMFLMAQSGFGVSNANFGNANLALAQKDDAGKARAVRCLTEEAIKKDEARNDNKYPELEKLLVGSTTPQKIGEMLKEAYIEYLVPRNNANAVREALKGKSSVEDMVATLVDTNLFPTDKKYLWWTIDGYDDPTDSIKGKFNAVVDQILKEESQSEGEGGWRNTAAEQAETNKKHDAGLLMNAITDAKTATDKNPIAGLTEKDFENGDWEIPGKDDDIPDNWKWNSVLDEINETVLEIGSDRSLATQEQKESIIDALQVFLGDRLMDKLITAGKSEEEDVGEALKNFFKGHFMRKVDEDSSSVSYVQFNEALDKIKGVIGDADNDKKERIYNVTFDAIFDTIEGLLRSKDAPVSIDMFNDGGIFSDTFKKTLVNLLDNLDSTERKWEKIGVAEDGPLANLRDQIKRIVWIDNDDNDVAGAKESDNESYDYDSSDINGGDSDEEQAERAEDAVTEGFKSANDLTGN